MQYFLQKNLYILLPDRTPLLTRGAGEMTYYRMTDYDSVYSLSGNLLYTVRKIIYFTVALLPLWCTTLMED